MKVTRWIFVAVAAIIVVSGILYLNNKAQSGETDNNRPRFKEYAVRRGTFHASVSATGVVKPIDRVEIKSKASGLIEEFAVEEGDFVAKGALICRLDQTDVKAEVDQAKADLDIAEAELNLAQNNYGRQERLFEKGMISEEQFDQTVLSLAQAKGQLIRATTSLDQANVRFSETIVKAPIDGIILQKYVESGQIIASGINNVSGGTSIADIADMSSVYIEAGIDEIDIGKIHIGQEVTVIPDAYPATKFAGRIIRIAPEATVEQNVTLFNVIIEVANRDGLLKSGMNADVEITLVKEDNVLIIPAVAVQSSDNRGHQKGTQVLLKDGDRFVRRDITIGSGDFKQIVVTSGLEEGDTIGVPMMSRIQAENERMEERIKNSRNFGPGG